MSAPVTTHLGSGQDPHGAARPTPLLEACDLVQRFPLRGTGGFLRRPRLQAAVDGVSLALYPGEVVAVVGESGSGKTTLGRMMLGLLTPTEGRVLYQGQDIAGLHGEAWRRFRRDVQVVFQDTGGSLNPRHNIGHSIALPLRHNRDMDAVSAAAEVDRLLDAVGLPATHFRERLPSELSGGQRQRVGIARALASKPALIVADEPVSALDVSVRAQILRLMADLRARGGLSYLFITHDLGVVRALADRVVVMLQGRVVESGTVDAVLGAPRHDYTRQLLAATPVPDPSQPLRA